MTLVTFACSGLDRFLKIKRNGVLTCNREERILLKLIDGGCVY